MLYVLGAWGGRHFSDGNVTGIVDATNGHPVRPMVIDRSSGRSLNEMDLRIATPPGA